MNRPVWSIKRGSHMITGSTFTLYLQIPAAEKDQSSFGKHHVPDFGPEDKPYWTEVNILKILRKDIQKKNNAITSAEIVIHDDLQDENTEDGWIVRSL